MGAGAWRVAALAPEIALAASAAAAISARIATGKRAEVMLSHIKLNRVGTPSVTCRAKDLDGASDVRAAPTPRARPAHTFVTLSRGILPRRRGRSAGAGPRRSAGSATIRTSTPGRPGAVARAASAPSGRRSARGRASARACPSARRCCRARAPRGSRPRRRLRPPRRAAARRAPRSAGAAPPAACGRPRSGPRPGGRTTSTSSSASRRCAERHARRTTRSELARERREREQALGDRLRRELPRRLEPLFLAADPELLGRPSVSAPGA